MRPAGTDECRRYPHPHHRRRERRVGVRRVRVQPEQISARIRRSRRQRPGPQFPGPRQPLRRHRLDRSPGPLRCDHHKAGIHRSAHQWRVLLRTGDLSLQASLADHLGQRFRPPQSVHHDRQPRDPFPSATEEGDLPWRSQQSGQVGDSRWHRLGREKGQLTHSSDIKAAARTASRAGPRNWRPGQSRTVSATEITPAPSVLDDGG